MNPWLPMRLCSCTRCGFTFGHPALVGRKPRLCQHCRTVPEPPVGAFNPGSPGYRLARDFVDLRLAVEQARAALRMGRDDVALAVLDRVEAPGQTHRPPTQRVRTP